MPRLNLNLQFADLVVKFLKMQAKPIDQLAKHPRQPVLPVLQDIRYLSLGFAGAGISGRLTDRKLITEGNWKELRRRATVFSDIAKKYS